MSLVEKYNNFLDENNIEDIIDLMEILIQEPYNMNFSKSNTHKNLLMISHTERTELNDISNIFNNIIINKEDLSEIVCNGEPIIKLLSIDNIYTHCDYKLSNMKFFKSNDGITIKLFYNNDRWVASSNDIIDTDEVPIENSEFTLKFLFDTVFPKRYYNLLNKNHVYKFGLYHNITRNVIYHKQNSLVHIKTYDRTSFNEVEFKLPIQEMQEITFNNLYELVNIIKYMDWKLCGFIGYNQKTNKYFKILSESFMTAQLLQSYDSDRLLRCLKLKHDELEDTYLKYFTEEKIFFQTINNLLDKYAKYFYHSYINIKIKKIFKPENQFIPYEKDIIYKIHKLYIQTRINTNLDTVKIILKNYEPERLFEIILTKTINIQ
jgi:hypothetical protein